LPKTGAKMGVFKKVLYLKSGLASFLPVQKKMGKNCKISLPMLSKDQDY